MGKKLRKGHKELLEKRLPEIRVSACEPDPHFETTMGLSPKQIWLEIGFGGGEHLVAQARANPAIGFIGCEPFINGVAKVLSAIHGEGLKNIRLCDDDARPLLDQLPDASIDRAFVLFSDPWPKKRHHKRRFFVSENLDRLARVLKDNAELRIASDHMEFLGWSLERLLAHPDLQWTALSANDWRKPPADWVQTRYEEKALARGDRPAYLIFRRRHRR